MCGLPTLFCPFPYKGNFGLGLESGKIRVVRVRFRGIKEVFFFIIGSAEALPILCVRYFR